MRENETLPPPPEEEEESEIRMMAMAMVLLSEWVCMGGWQVSVLPTRGGRGRETVRLAVADVWASSDDELAGWLAGCLASYAEAQVMTRPVGYCILDYELQVKRWVKTV